MSRSDAEIGREALEEYFPHYFGGGFGGGDGGDIAKVVQYIRAAIRADIEREVIERLIAEAAEISRVNDEAEWGPEIYEAPLYFVPSDEYYANTCAPVVITWLRSKIPLSAE